jgi:integrase
MTRKRLATLGKRGALVRVMDTTAHGVRRYIVMWGGRDAREQQSFPGTPAGKREAMAFAEAFAAEVSRPVVTKPAEPITTEQLWTAYRTAAFPALRNRTKIIYRDAWMRWELFYGADRAARDMTIDDCDQFRAELERVGLATATIAQTIRTVRTVFNYAERTEKIDRNRWHQFELRVAKERRTKPRAEYPAADFARIWAQLDPTSATMWRPWVAIGLLGIYGMRQNATLHLQWSDVDEVLGTLTFRAEHDKQGEEHVQPLLPIAREVLAVAHAWRDRDGYTGPWVLPSGNSLNKGETYTIQSLWKALNNAEQRAGIAKIRFRSGHGFRRGLVGDLLEAGAELELALKAIGDRDLSMARHYAIKRNARIEQALTTRAESFTTAPRRAERATNVQSAAELDEAAPQTHMTKATVTSTLTEG